MKLQIVFPAQHLGTVLGVDGDVSLLTKPVLAAINTQEELVDGDFSKNQSSFDRVTALFHKIKNKLVGWK